MAEGGTDTETITDEERVVQFCLQNKVSKSATDELIKRGFTSLEALKLVELDDLGSEKIPRGQRRLILHIVRMTLQEGTAANDTATAGESLSVGTDDGTATSVNNTTSGSAIPVTIVQEVEQNVMENTNNNTDMYTGLLSNMQFAAKDNSGQYEHKCKSPTFVEWPPGPHLYHLR